MLNGGMYLLDVFGLGCEANNIPREFGFQLSCQTLPTIRGSNLFVSVQRVGLVKTAGANLFEMIYSSACNVIENPHNILDSVGWTRATSLSGPSLCGIVSETCGRDDFVFSLTLPLTKLKAPILA